MTEEWEHEDEVIRASYSAMTLHRKCAQAWLFRYGIGLNEPDTAPAPERDFGSWWGVLRAAESLERGRALSSLRSTPREFRGVDDGPRFDQRTVTVEDVFDAAESWWRERTHSEHDSWEERLGEGLPARLRSLFHAWRSEWDDQIMKEEPLGVEVKWERMLPRPAEDREWDPSKGMPEIQLFGYIDEVYFDRSKGMVAVRDHKTKKALDAATAADDMMDSQLQLYAWGAAPMIAEYERGPVRIVAYDRARSVAPKTPQLTLTGTLSKSVTAYDLATYQRWASGPEGNGVPWGDPEKFYTTGPKKGLPKSGVYTAETSVLDRLSTPTECGKWFQRTTVPLSMHIVRSHLRAAVDTATDIWRTERRAEQTHEAARSLSRTNCTWCDYAQLCRAQMIGGPSGTYELEQYGLVSRDGRKLLMDGELQ